MPPTPKASKLSGPWSIDSPNDGSTIVWNARGLCSSERQRELKEICNENSIEIFGALETKARKFEEATEKMGTDWTIIRNAVGESHDSIWLEWKQGQWSASILQSHEQYIHARMLNPGGYSFNLTVVYSEGTVVKRRPTTLKWNHRSSIDIG